MKGSVRKRGEKWYYRINLGIIDGKRKEIERPAGESKKEALRVMRQAMAEMEMTNQYFEPSDKSLSDYMDEWLESYKINLKGYTMRSYQSIINIHIKPSIGKYKLANLSPVIIQKFIDKKKNDGYSKSTINSIFVVLKKALSYAVQPYAYLKMNPAQNIHMPRFTINDAKTVTSFTDTQMKSIFKRFAFPHQFYIVIALSYYTGMRMGECLALDWNDVDLNNQIIHIHNTLYDKDKKNITVGVVKTKASIRDIYFTKQLDTVFTQQKQRQAENKLKADRFYNYTNYICTRDDGIIMTASNLQYFNLWCKDEFGKDSGLSFHSLRHTHATLLMENNADIKYISARLGHSSVKITLDTYAHVTDKLQEKNTKIIEENFL